MHITHGIQTAVAVSLPLAAASLLAFLAHDMKRTAYIYTTWCTRSGHSSGHTRYRWPDHQLNVLSYSSASQNSDFRVFLLFLIVQSAVAIPAVPASKSEWLCPVCCNARGDTRACSMVLVCLRCLLRRRTGSTPQAKLEVVVEGEYTHLFLHRVRTQSSVVDIIVVSKNKTIIILLHNNYFVCLFAENQQVTK